jgi:2-dehydro-3-deoxy-D-arabinonate dehydratase
MKIYNTKSGIIIEKTGKFFIVSENWDVFINDDNLTGKIQDITQSPYNITHESQLASHTILPPIGHQELWACGVTYLKSKVGRQEESKTTGGGDYYTRVYEAERPEVFFKATAHRVVGHNSSVRIRGDSTWNVPEPELTLVVTSSGKIVGYTIGNDMSSRSIEGENPLYLPQAKTYDGCAALGPCVYVTDKPLSPDTLIQLEILRDNKTIFKDTVALNQMKRSLDELVSFVCRECSFPVGCLIMTGTGIVPPNDFTLSLGDEIRISIDSIGTLINTVN